MVTRRKNGRAPGVPKETEKEKQREKKKGIGRRDGVSFHVRVERITLYRCPREKHSEYSDVAGTRREDPRGIRALVSRSERASSYVRFNVVAADDLTPSSLRGGGGGGRALLAESGNARSNWQAPRESRETGGVSFRSHQEGVQIINAMHGFYRYGVARRGKRAARNGNGNGSRAKSGHTRREIALIAFRRSRDRCRDASVADRRTYHSWAFGGAVTVPRTSLSPGHRRKNCGNHRLGYVTHRTVPRYCACRRLLPVYMCVRVCAITRRAAPRRARCPWVSHGVSPVTDLGGLG